MFTSGQIIFAVLFIIVFALVIFFTYRKDKRLHAKNYKGAIWVAWAFLIFVIVLFCIKYFLKN